MPIGKNSIKRVTNNGYSKVASTAPDMENSVIEEKKTQEPKDTKPSTEKTVAKTGATKKAPVRKPTSQKATSKPTEKKTAPVSNKKTPAQAKPEKKEADKPSYVNLGRELPTYLL